MSRYARQISLTEIGPDGQKKLANTRLAIVGCGGLGAIAAAYLAGAGVGYIRLIDGDQPAVSNLHRQVFFATGESSDKASALAKHLTALNPEVDVGIRASYLSKHNAKDLLEGVDLIVECTDQAWIKHLVSDFCVLEEIPLIYGSVHRFQGYVALFANQKPDDVHLRDLFPEPDDRLPTCAEVGVLNTAAGLIGLLQANEALKWILNIGESLRNRLLTYDSLSHRQHILQLAKTFQGDIEDIWETTTYGFQDREAPEVTWDELAAWLVEDYQLISLLSANQEPKLQPNAVRYQKGMAESVGKKVFYCQYGRQSLAVAKQLRVNGIEAYSIVGGLKDLMTRGGE
ncbi:MAG: HesA/MoeB/ThiF family protein [Bacteroidota bacterium]